MKNRNIKTGTKLYVKFFYLLIAGAFFISFFFFSCDHPVNFENPFDPNISLPSPSNLNIVNMLGNSLVLRWNSNINVSSEEQIKQIKSIIEQSADGKNFSAIDTLRDTVTTVSITKDFLPGKKYYFRIYMLIGSRISGYSNVVNGTSSTAYDPSGFSVQIISETLRKFTWQDNSPSELGFEIFRRIGDAGDFKIFAQLQANTTTFDDTSVIHTDTTNYYRIFAKFSDNNLSFYDSLKINIPFPAPYGLQATALSKSSIRLDWNNSSPFKSDFIIQRCKRGENYSFLAKNESGNQTFIDNNLDTTFDYFYRIKAISQYNQSKYSDEIKIGYYPENSSASYFSNVYFGGYCPVVQSNDGKFIFFGGNFVGDNDDSYGHFDIFNTFERNYSKEGIHGAKLTCATFSKDDNLLVTSSDDGFIRIWNRNDLTLYKKIPFNGEIKNLVISGDNSKVVGSDDNKIYFWELNNGNLFYTSGLFSQKISAFSLSPDGKNFACASGNKVQIFSFSAGNIIYTFPDFSSTVKAIKYSSNNLLAEISQDGRVDTWDCNNYTLKGSIKGLSPNLYKLFFTNDNKFIVVYVGFTFSYLSQSGIWRLSDNQLVRLWEGGGGDVVSQIEGTNIICSYLGSGSAEIDYRTISYKWDLLNK